MEKGTDFLKSQVNNAVMLHHSFVEALEDHEEQADDTRYRELCARYIPIMKEHQRQLEDYQKAIGSEVGVGKKVMGKVAGAARGLADVARENDFLRLVGDIVMSRQAEDTFRTFREAGRTLGDQKLARIGEVGEQQHDDYSRDANRLVQTLFVENVRGEERPEKARKAGEAERRPTI